jgi:hypothetical protein
MLERAIIVALGGTNEGNIVEAIIPVGSSATDRMRSFTSFSMTTRMYVIRSSQGAARILNQREA